MMKKPINHKSLGGKIVDLKKPLPQRKSNKAMNGEELLVKAFNKPNKIKKLII